MSHPELIAAPDTDEVLYAQEGAVGRLVLNRPRSINALNLPMVRAVSALLARWEQDAIVQTVTIEGAGERGLCAGGDVIAVRRAALEGGDRTEFFEAEYAMNQQLADFPRPVVAFMDGVVMGGGVGISSFATHRLVTERSRVAMPETVIGFFPDVGALYLLSRSPGELGTHIALTGSTLDGPNAILAGLADRLITSDQWPDLRARWAGGEPLDEQVGQAEPTATLAHQEWIQECYTGDDPAAIVQRLEAHADPDAQEAGRALRGRSPLAVAVTLEALRRAATLETVAEVLAQDLVIATYLAAQPDFAEGVRAQLVDRDRAPVWSHRRIEEVPRAQVEAAFKD